LGVNGVEVTLSATMSWLVRRVGWLPTFVLLVLLSLSASIYLSSFVDSLTMSTSSVAMPSLATSGKRLTSVNV
jgi:hypothetical protein